MMQHLVAKAATVAEELGTFTAIASAWDADREDDTIARDAFDQTIAAWRGSGKRLPLLWEHGSEVVGFVEPDEMHTDERGLIIGGEIDRETDRGKQAWKMIKSRVAGFSIGFASESRPRKSGGRLITSVDLLEISVTPRPIHPATKPLSWKSAAAATTLTAEEQATFRALRLEWEARAAAGAEEEEEEESPIGFVPTRRTQLLYDGTTWTEVRGKDGGGTPEQIAEHHRALRREQLERDEIHRARAARAAQQPPTFPICGLRVRAGGVVVDPR